MLEGPIGENTASVLCAQLLFLESQDAAKDITLYINCLLYTSDAADE